MTDLSLLDDAAFDSDQTPTDDLDQFVDERVADDPSFAEGLSDVACRQEIIRILVNRRHTADLSQTDVAARMGTTQSAVSDIEGGARDLYLSTLQRYARAVGAYVGLSVSVSGPAGLVRTTPSSAVCFSLDWRRRGDMPATGYVERARLGAEACA